MSQGIWTQAPIERFLNIFDMFGIIQFRLLDLLY